MKGQQKLFLFQCDQMEDEGKDDVRYGIMAISKQKDSYILNCGNVIKSTNRVKVLRERLESLKSMSTQKTHIIIR